MFGEYNQDIIPIYDGFCIIYTETDKLDKVIEYKEKILKIYLYYNETHPKITEINNEIGLHYIVQGNYSKALQYFEKNLKIFRKNAYFDLTSSLYERNVDTRCPKFGTFCLEVRLKSNKS